MRDDSIHIIGMGSAGLFLALALRDCGRIVHVYDQQSAAARKFLVAGEGGLNLTHSEPAVEFLSRYTPSEFLRAAFTKFDNQYFMDWLRQHEIPLFTGSSARVFPEAGIKPARVLSQLLSYLEVPSVQVHYRHQWQGIDEAGHLLFKNQQGFIHVPSSTTVFALGGASWPVTGSKGDWLHFFSERGIQVAPFQASNCRFICPMSSTSLDALAGKPLKNIGLQMGDEKRIGEIVFNSQGIEGSGCYPFSPLIRTQLKESGEAFLLLDLKPHNTADELLTQLNKTPQVGSWTEKVRTALRLDATAMRLLKELCSKETYLDGPALMQRLKALPLPIRGLGPLEEAISTVGGIVLEEVDENFELRQLPGTYVLGEMLDYDAPTGGYLLQSCFSMAMHLAEHLRS